MGAESWEEPWTGSEDSLLALEPSVHFVHQYPPLSSLNQESFSICFCFWMLSLTSLATSLSGDESEVFVLWPTEESTIVSSFYSSHHSTTRCETALAEYNSRTLAASTGAPFGNHVPQSPERTSGEPTVNSVKQGKQFQGLLWRWTSEVQNEVECYTSNQLRPERENPTV